MVSNTRAEPLIRVRVDRVPEHITHYVLGKLAPILFPSVSEDYEIVSPP